MPSPRLYYFTVLLPNYDSIKSAPNNGIEILES